MFLFHRRTPGVYRLSYRVISLLYGSFTAMDGKPKGVVLVVRGLTRSNRFHRRSLVVRSGHDGCLLSRTTFDCTRVALHVGRRRPAYTAHALHVRVMDTPSWDGRETPRRLATSEPVVPAPKVNFWWGPRLGKGQGVLEEEVPLVPVLESELSLFDDGHGLQLASLSFVLLYLIVCSGLHATDQPG